MNHQNVRKAQGIGCAVILFLFIPFVAFAMWGPFGLVLSLVLSMMVAIALYYSFLREKGEAEEPETVEPEKMNSGKDGSGTGQGSGRSGKSAGERDDESGEENKRDS